MKGPSGTEEVAAEGLTEEQGQLQTPCQRVQHFFVFLAVLCLRLDPFLPHLFHFDPLLNWETGTQVRNSSDKTEETLHNQMTEQT